MHKVILIIFTFLNPLLSMEKGLENAVNIIATSQLEGELLTATKVIVDSDDQEAWLALIKHLGNEKLMLKESDITFGDEQDPSFNIIWPTFFSYFEVIYSSQNRRLLDFLKILGSSPSYLRNRDFSALFADKLKSYRNKDEAFYLYVSSLYQMKLGNAIRAKALQEILIQSGQKEYHHQILIKNGYTTGQVIFGKEQVIEDFYNSANLAALARHRDVPYNFQVLVNLCLRSKGMACLDYILDDREEFKDSMTQPFCVSLSPKTLKDCQAYEKMLLSLRGIKEGDIMKLKYQKNLDAKLNKIRRRVAELKAENPK